MLTVDTPVVGTKYAAGDQVVWDVVDPELLRVNFDPGYEDAPGAEKAHRPRPARPRLAGRADRAARRRQGGAPRRRRPALRPGRRRAVWVSNHGGRQLDRAATTASCLPAVAAAVEGEAQVYVDGGIRSGLDVLAALALGADAVFLGRLPLYALVDGRRRGRRGCTPTSARRPSRRSGWRAAGPSRTPAESPRSAVGSVGWERAREPSSPTPHGPGQAPGPQGKSQAGKSQGKPRGQVAASGRGKPPSRRRPVRAVARALRPPPSAVPTRGAAHQGAGRVRRPRPARGHHRRRARPLDHRPAQGAAREAGRPRGRSTWPRPGSTSTRIPSSPTGTRWRRAAARRGWPWSARPPARRRTPRATTPRRWPTCGPRSG